MPHHDDQRKKDDERKHRNELIRGLSTISQVGFSIVACVLIGIFLGRFLDRVLNTSPWLLVIFTLLGAVAAFKSIFDIAKRR